MPKVIQPATLTSKGQITLPKPIRQALGVDAGSKVNFELRKDGQVVMTRADDGHRDPAIGAFLTLLAQDIELGRNIRELPQDLARAMLAETGHSTAEEIDGDIAL